MSRWRNSGGHGAFFFLHRKSEGTVSHERHTPQRAPRTAASRSSPGLASSHRSSREPSIPELGVHFMREWHLAIRTMWTTELQQRRGDSPRGSTRKHGPPPESPCLLHPTLHERLIGVVFLDHEKAAKHIPRCACEGFRRTCLDIHKSSCLAQQANLRHAPVHGQTSCLGP